MDYHKKKADAIQRPLLGKKIINQPRLIQRRSQSLQQGPVY